MENVFFTNLRGWFLLITLGVGMQVSLGQELFTAQPLEKSGLPTKLQEKLGNIERNALHKQVQYVRLGNLAKIQKNGVLTFSIPGANKTVTFNARRVEAESDQDFLWVGKSDDQLHQAIFICKKGKLSGSIETKGGYYQVYTTEEGIGILLEIDPSKGGECSVTGHSATPQLPKSIEPKSGRMEACQEATRVLVLYTPASATLVPDIEQTADLSIAQYNSALNNSNIGNAVTNTLVKAGVALINFQEGTNVNADVVTISQRIDAQSLRDQYKADIVIILTSGYSYYPYQGSVIEIPANNNSGYAIVVSFYASATGLYTFSHEMGHLFGGLHENDNTSASYDHGYVLPGDINGTVMARLSAFYGDRILYFSNPEVSYNGEATGNYGFSHVARRISEVSPTVVDFRSSVSRPFSAYIEGTSYVGNTGTYRFEAVYQCINPTSYEWSVSRDGFNFGSPIGYSENQYSFINSSNNGLYYLRCKMTLPSGQVYTTYRYVSVNICNGCKVAEKAVNDDSAPLLEVSPNPGTGNSVNVRFSVSTETSVTVNLTDSRATPVKKLDFGVLSPGIHQKKIDVSSVSPGLYIVTLQTGTEVRSQKVLLTK
jgi:Metallo-peptidase family M12/Secretion system C-terminal sorting domain